MRENRRFPAISRIGQAPGLDPGDGFRTVVVVGVLRQPFRLTFFLARRLAGLGSAVFLVSFVAPVRRETQPAMPALPSFLSPPLVSSPNASCVGLLHDPPRKPKKIQTAKKNQAQLQQGEEEPLSRRPARAGFGSAATVNGAMRVAILGNVIGRMAEPAAELATWNGLQTQSGLGELIDVDFADLSHRRLYRASDLLMRHRAEIEEHLFSSIQTLFSLEETVTLYDLTNTYVEGEAAANPKAHFGRSKEKRSDCPLVTLGLVLDGSGFIRRSKTFEGHVSEGGTLAGMLSGLGAPPGARVIMDAGIASEANVTWLSEHGYRYRVVRRGGVRQFDETRAVVIETAGGEALRLQKVTREDGKEVELYCHSAGREAKETARVARFGAAFEAGLQKIADGLHKPRSEKRVDKLLERIGRLKEKSRGASQHYTVSLVGDDLDTKGKRATALTWVKNPVAGTMATHPGVYCLRSNETTWNEERLWRTYTMLTDLESVFRSLKSELGLRPVFHQKEDRADGPLFITVLAYQCVQVLRTQLKKAGINASWATLRKTLSVQRRLTSSLRRQDGRTIHVRKSSVAEPALMAIYQALAINPAPGGTKKLIC